MNVSFIDTSIIMNLLEIPQRCQNAEEIKKEFKEAEFTSDDLLALAEKFPDYA